MYDTLIRQISELLASGAKRASDIGQHLRDRCPSEFEQAKLAHGSLSNIVSALMPDTVTVIGSGPSVMFSLEGAPPPSDPPTSMASVSTGEPNPYRTLLSPASLYKVRVELATGALSVTGKDELPVEGCVDVEAVPPEALQRFAQEFVADHAPPEARASLIEFVERKNWWGLKNAIVDERMRHEFGQGRKALLRDHFHAVLASAGATPDQIALALANLERVPRRSPPTRYEKSRQARELNSPNTIRSAPDFAELLRFAANNMSENDIRRFVLPMCGRVLDKLVD